MGSCAIYILILPDNTVIVEKPMYENEMQLSGCIFYNPESKKFERFVQQLRELGYEVELRELIAADYGAPTMRKRFFMIARCDGKPIV